MPPDDGNWKTDVENRLTKIETTLASLQASVGQLLVAIVGSSENPGVGLQLRMDRLEQRASLRSRLFWTLVGFVGGVIMLLVREWVAG